MTSKPQDKNSTKPKQVTRKRFTEANRGADPQPIGQFEEGNTNSSHPPNQWDLAGSQTGQPQIHAQALANLAVQLLQPELSKMRDSSRRLSDESFDSIYYDALVRADSLLKLAAETCCWVGGRGDSCLSAI
jgi:hypothetical protein